MTIDTHSQLGMLAAPVACVDRRSLSQAWYSALYGEGRPQPRAASPIRTGDCGTPGVRARRMPQAAAVREIQCAQTIKAQPQQSAATATGAAERRALPTQLARRIERTLRRAPAVSKASLCVEAGGARVQLLFRSSSCGLHVVAICSAKVQRQVAAALLQARFALARRGISLYTSTSGRA